MGTRSLFTKIMDQAVAQLRLKDVNILAYLDDLLVWSDTAQTLKKDTQTTLDYLRYLGWTINLAKSRLEPQQRFQYLGLEWDLVNYTVSVPNTKVTACQIEIKGILKCRYLSTRQAQSIIDSLNFVAINSLIL